MCPTKRWITFVNYSFYYVIIIQVMLIFSIIIILLFHTINSFRSSYIYIYIYDCKPILLDFIFINNLLNKFKFIIEIESYEIKHMRVAIEYIIFFFFLLSCSIHIIFSFFFCCYCSWRWCNSQITWEQIRRLLSKIRTKNDCFFYN